MKIEPCNFSDNEYKELVNIWNATYPMYPGSVSEIKNDDKTRLKKITFKRYVLRLDKKAIGFGVFLNSSSAYHPQEFVITPVIMPEHHNKGYGKALYNHLINELKPFKPTVLMSWSREDWPRKNCFLTDRGFTETLRSFESRLNVTEFNDEAYKSLEANLKNQGINIQTAAELSDDVDFHRKVYDLHTTLDLDVPMVGEYTKPSFEEFATQHWLDQRYLPETFIVATQGNNYIGMSEHFQHDSIPDRLNIGLTGVLNEYRRKGVALAMKVKAIKAAKALEAKELSTWNASHNTGMLVINEELGFKKQPATIDYIKKLNS